MMNKVFITALILLGTLSLHAQKIAYTEPDRDDSRATAFDVVGKINDQYIIFKNNHNVYTVNAFDGDMKLVNKVKLDFLPDRVISTDLLVYKEFFYLFYQYQHKNIVYCMAAKLDGQGKLINDLITMDTTHINSLAQNKVYTFMHSDDKQKVVALKINSRDPENYKVTTNLFDAGLTLIKKSALQIRMPDRNDFLTEFVVDNDGDIAFVRASGSTQSDNINNLKLFTKNAMADSVAISDINIGNSYLDDIRVKVDNLHKHYLLISFYAKQHRGNIDGLFAELWSKPEGRAIVNTTIPFSDELKRQAKSEGNVKSAFDNFFLQNIVMERDGGFAIAAESVYTSSRGGNYYNRWDYMNGSPYMSPSDYYFSGSNFGNDPWNRYGYYGQVTRYYADNIAVMSFDSTGKMEWSNVINKSQYDDNTDSFLGYATLNTGSVVHFIFNQLDKRTLLLTDQSITAEGELIRSPTLHSLDRGYEFMPRYGKQVGSRQIIMPCQYRNYICFAKIDF
jgi:hypothetical protein